MTRRKKPLPELPRVYVRPQLDRRQREACRAFFVATCSGDKKRPASGTVDPLWLRWGMRASLIQQRAGWVLVPVEATPEMLRAMAEVDAPGQWDAMGADELAETAAHLQAWFNAALAAAPAAPAAEPVGWVPVTERMPKSGQTVLACYTNRAGNVRRIRAEWVAAKSREATSDDSDIGVYDEATDTFYDPEGWYELIDNWGDYSSVVVTEGEVTHWMPLPAAPGAAPAQSREPLTQEQKLILWHKESAVHKRNSAFEWYAAGVEASERAHGIGSQP